MKPASFQNSSEVSVSVSVEYPEEAEYLKIPVGVAHLQKSDRTVWEQERKDKGFVAPIELISQDVSKRKIFIKLLVMFLVLVTCASGVFLGLVATAEDSAEVDESIATTKAPTLHPTLRPTSSPTLFPTADTSSAANVCASFDFEFNDAGLVYICLDGGSSAVCDTTTGLLVDDINHCESSNSVCECTGKLYSTTECPVRDECLFPIEKVTELPTSKPTPEPTLQPTFDLSTAAEVCSSFGFEFTDGKLVYLCLNTGASAICNTGNGLLLSEINDCSEPLNTCECTGKRYSTTQCPVKDECLLPLPQP